MYVKCGRKRTQNMIERLVVMLSTGVITAAEHQPPGEAGWSVPRPTLAWRHMATYAAISRGSGHFRAGCEVL